MDIVFIDKLKVDTVIGVYPHERNIRQTLEFDLELAHDNRKAGASDDLTDALDYDAISKRIIAEMQAKDFFLIEAAAEYICGMVMTEFNVPWMRLTVYKPGAVSAAASVGVKIERGQIPD